MSANIIDALVVMLGLDSKDLESKQPGAVKKLTQLEKTGERTEKSVAKVGKASKETARSIEGLSRTLTGLLAIIGGTVAIKNFVHDFIDTNAQLDRLSKNLGLSVSTISAWSNATQKLGGSAQGLQSTLDMLSRSQTELMITGNSSLIPYMSALGVSLSDVNGKARPVTDILLDLSDRFSHMNRTTANNIGRSMGLDQGTMNLLLQGRKELELEIRRQKEQTAVTKQQADAAQKLQTQIVGVKQKFAALGRSALMDAIPYIEKLLNVFRRLGKWAQEHEQFIADFLKVLAVGLAAIAVVTMPIDLAVAAVLALGLAIALLWDDYQTWKKGGNSLIDWGKWQPGIDAAIKGIKELTEVVEALLSKFNDSGWDKVKSFFGIQPKGTHSKFTTDFGAGWSGIKSALGVNTGANMKGRVEHISAGEIQKYFTDRGWTSAQAAGIAANLMSESNGNTRALGDNGTAFGLAQWHPDRQAAFKKWSGHDISSATLEEQLAFVQHELTRGNFAAAGKALRNTTDATQAGAVVSQQYERPADASGQALKRGALAQSLVGIPGAASIAQSAPSSSSSNSSVDKSVHTQIGSVVVNSSATDADGIARDMGSSLDYLFTSQMNFGMVP